MVAPAVHRKKSLLNESEFLKVKYLSLFLAIDFYLLFQCFSANPYPKKEFYTLFYINYRLTYTDKCTYNQIRKVKLQFYIITSLACSNSLKIILKVYSCLRKALSYRKLNIWSPECTLSLIYHDKNEWSKRQNFCEFIQVTTVKFSWCFKPFRPG